MHSRGGLHTLFSMVLGGLVAATPHMVAATVMALARLLYEFAGPLEYKVDDLLPAVLALLRTKSREVVKAVLGFVKVHSWPFNLYSLCAGVSLTSPPACLSYQNQPASYFYSTMLSFSVSLCFNYPWFDLHSSKCSTIYYSDHTVLHSEASLAPWKVIAMRLPVPVVTVHLKAILEGILLWSADTKNQFKLKVGCFITHTSHHHNHHMAHSTIDHYMDTSMKSKVTKKTQMVGSPLWCSVV